MHKQVTVVEAGGNHAIYQELTAIWETQGLGNDFVYYPWDADQAAEYPSVAEYIKANQIEGMVLLHYSW